MPPKTVQRFWDNDMHQNKDLKRVAGTEFYATRFRARSMAGRVVACGTAINSRLSACRICQQSRRADACRLEVCSGSGITTCIKQGTKTSRMNQFTATRFRRPPKRRLPFP
ncbi:hypothetical protein ELI38_01940 [Rhizobium leguminosarum]|nr:hypothetical protein ELI38_01940 [Rhizobium leguminosarum]TAV09304.1 hypothetical protein ELI37_01570 [Rhizobium leguminosarum]TAW50221.1 hypothetical protein ELI14_01945 [Rhizobium leguminosarum]TAX49091.1 hypothetical protein ELH99_02020 [Rhizobium leguminosarum]